MGGNPPEEDAPPPPDGGACGGLAAPPLPPAGLPPGGTFEVGRKPEPGRLPGSGAAGVGVVVSVRDIEVSLVVFLSSDDSAFCAVKTRPASGPAKRSYFFWFSA